MSHEEADAVMETALKEKFAILRRTYAKNRVVNKATGRRGIDTGRSIVPDEEDMEYLTSPVPASLVVSAGTDQWEPES